MYFTQKMKTTLWAGLMLSFLIGFVPVAAASRNYRGMVSDQKFPVSTQRKPIRIIRTVATAYSSDPAQTSDHPCRPAMWSYDLCQHFLENGEENTIAANFLPLGTKVRFPDLYGRKIYVVRDRLNERYNYDVIGYYRVDVYQAMTDENGDLSLEASREKALEFGFKKNIKMEILGV